MPGVAGGVAEGEVGDMLGTEPPGVEVPAAAFGVPYGVLCASAPTDMPTAIANVVAFIHIRLFIVSPVY
jgi:hypothetical protein